MIKKSLLSLALSLLTLAAFADPGMWLPSLIGSRIEDMQSKGFTLSAEDIYSINNPSMKDAVVLFGGGCTGEVVSNEGLLLTNHHCGYGAVQRLSSVDADYLTNGYWAKSKEQELWAKGLNVKFLVRMEDVTERLAAGETEDEIIAAAQKEGVGYRAEIEPMYYGNQQFLFVYEQFDDVRLVGTPPSSIGKFGGDTDNWIWPRHTGDFSVFRIYADANNRPAAYSPDNRPYTPKRYLPISIKGVNEGDFTMIYGFPGSTQNFLTSRGVEYVAHRSDPLKVDIRTQRLDVISAAQESDPAVRLHYAAIHATIANSWKKWQGELLGIDRLQTIPRKKVYENKFSEWAVGKANYEGLVVKINAEYDRIEDGYFTLELLSETLRTLTMSYGEEQRSNPIFEKIAAVDAQLYRIAVTEYFENCPAEMLLAQVKQGVERCGSTTAYADELFESLMGDNVEPLEQLAKAIKEQQGEIVKTLGAKSLRNLSSERLDDLYKSYIAGLREWDTERAFFPDANLTLRVAYGKVEGYEYADGELHTPQTSIDGIIAKDNPNIYDYDIPQQLREIYKTKEYGRWGLQLNGHQSVPVCFLASNHTTGGNSGSPIINGNGELIGINFDRTWRSTMSDIEFDPTICRNISVDIRYVLFVIEKIGGAGYLLDEMDLRE